MLPTGCSVTFTLSNVETFYYTHSGDEGLISFPFLKIPDNVALYS
jgi:hypothetical protein